MGVSLSMTENGRFSNVPVDQADCQTQNRTLGNLSDTRELVDALLWNSNSKRATPPFPLKSLDLLLLLLVVLTVALIWKCKTHLMTSETWCFICWKYGSLAVDSSCSSVPKFLLQVPVNLFSWRILSRNITFTFQIADCPSLQSTPTSRQSRVMLRKFLCPNCVPCLFSTLSSLCLTRLVCSSRVIPFAAFPAVLLLLLLK